MQMKLTAICATTLLVAASLPAWAQGSGLDNATGAKPERPMSREEARNNSGAVSLDRRQRRERDRRLDQKEYEQYYENARHPVFRRGGYMPPLYRGQQYWVNDWNRHGLRRPPSGHRWVQVGGDYVLMAIATGVIVELLLNQ